LPARYPGTVISGAKAGANLKIATDGGFDSCRYRRR
jgi:hypothetical protein